MNIDNTLAVPSRAIPRQNLPLQIALSVTSVILVLLVVEGAVRLREFRRYGSATAAMYTLSFDSVSGLSIPTPNQVTPTIRIDSRGFRNPDLLVPKPSGTVRLAFIGASTTFCAEVSDNAHTWPDVVTNALRQDWPARQFDYVNAGVPGYTVDQSLKNLEYRVKPLQPDVIVLYEGINDLSRDSRLLAEQQGIVRGTVDDTTFLDRWSLTYFLIKKNLQLKYRQEQATTKEASHVVFQPGELSRGFEGKLRQLVGLAQSVTPTVALVTISQKVRRDQPAAEQLKNANTDLYYMPHMTVAGIEDGFDEYNRVIRKVAHDTGSILIEGEDSIPADDAHFADSVHFTDAGAQAMAARVSGALRRELPGRHVLQ